MSPEKLSVKVNVAQSVPLDLTVKASIDELESKRAESERRFYDQAALHSTFIGHPHAVPNTHKHAVGHGWAKSLAACACHGS